MKNISIIWAVLFAMIAMLSCKDEVPERETSPLTNPNSNKVYFLPQKHEIFIPKEVSTYTFEVMVGRMVTTSSLSVDLLLSNSTTASITIPKSISFAADENEISFEVKIENLEMMIPYQFSIAVDMEQTSPYIKDSVEFNGKKIPVYPAISLNALKEDHEPYGKGIYEFSVIGGNRDWWEKEREVEIMYSPLTKKYRIKDFCGFKGYHINFLWDNTEVTMVDLYNEIGIVTENGEEIEKILFSGFESGYVYPNRGMIIATIDNNRKYEYNKETQEFTFNFVWKSVVWQIPVGNIPDYFTITEEY